MGPEAGAVMSAEGRLNTKRTRVKNYQREHPIGPPVDDPDKEDLCFEYLRHFLRVYASRWPKRSPPYLSALNEFGQTKLVCTTLRPTQLPFSELYDMHECAVFVAGYILYEPLDPPHLPPETLVSPSFTLNSYSGDSFDMAVLLCSLLLGGGYDAYVVNGWAPREVALKDQSSLECPQLTPLAETAVGPVSQSEDAEVVGDGYRPIDNEVRTSAFLAAEAERRRLAALDTFQLWEEHDPEPASTLSEVRVHAWVLVKAGRRDVREHVLFEPSTGKAYSSSGCPYRGISSLWNARNYWVLNKTDLQIADVNFDFENSTEWTSVFLAGSLGKQGGPAEDPALEPQPATEEESLVSFDPPLTWVPPIVLSRPYFLLRYPPHGQRSVLYFRAKLDRYAKYAHSQGLVMRLSKYLDNDRVIAKEIHEWFEGRKDKLYRRSRFILGKHRYIEYYHPGSEGEVRCWTEYPGKRIEIDFYVDGRLDRLKRREEDVTTQITDFFEGRVDRLIKQVTSLTTISAGDSEKLNNSDVSGGDLSLDTFITKIVQLFARGPHANNGNDVHKKTFNVRLGQALFQYHNPEGKIGLNVKVLNHSVRGADFYGDVGDKEHSSSENEQVRKQQAAAIGEFKDIHKLLQRDVVDIRRACEVEVRMQKSVFELALDAVDAGTAVSGTEKASAEEEEERSTDYLTPYLRHIEDPMRMSQKDALEVRQNCYNGYKERLLEREKIIQARLAEEKTKLARKQEQYPRTQRVENGRAVVDEEFEKQCAEAIFRIHVLEQRLIAHEEEAVKKLAALEEKLVNDPRLKTALKVA